MDTDQRSQATSQIAGLPHLIHGSNYTISCHCSCYLDLSSWPSREGWGVSYCPGFCGGIKEGRRKKRRRKNKKKNKGCSIQGSCTWGCKFSLFWSSWRGNCSDSSLHPPSDGRWFYKSASSLFACVWGVVFLILGLFFFSLHVAWSLLKLVLWSKKVRSDSDGQSTSSHKTLCNWTYSLFIRSAPCFALGRQIERAKG